MAIVFIHSVLDTIFAMLFLLKSPQTTWLTAKDLRWSVDHSLRNAGLEDMIWFEMA
jgi:hypothetical protein